MMRNCGAVYMEIIEDLGNVFAKDLDKEPASERRLRKKSTILLPQT